MNPITPPILFLIFNRPDTTAQVFEAIRSQRPERLYIAADGPRPGRPQEALNCQSAREIASHVDWPCEVRTLFREENLGCGRAVSQAISWFFEQEEEGIILEDDCLPHPEFFPYCAALLERYRNTPHVKVIGGNNFQHGMKWGDASYYLSAHSHIWGWATWRRVWKEYEFDVSGWDTQAFERDMGRYFISNDEKKHWRDVFGSMQRKSVDTWDYQLTFSVWKHGGVSIIPNVNLVSNIGFGPDATHTVAENQPRANMPTGSIFPLQHLGIGKKSSCKLADYYYARYYRAWDRLFHVEKRIIPMLAYCGIVM